VSRLSQGSRIGGQKRGVHRKKIIFFLYNSTIIDNHLESSKLDVLNSFIQNLSCRTCVYKYHDPYNNA